MIRFLLVTLSSVMQCRTHSGQGRASTLFACEGRLGQLLHVEPGRASFLLPVNIPELEELEMALQRKCRSTVTVIPVDDEFVEVSLSSS